MKRTTKKAKKQSFISFSSRLNRDTPVSIIWNYIAKLSNRKNRQNAQPLLVNNEIITSPEIKADAIACNYSKMLNSHSHLVDGTNLLVPISIALIDESNSIYNKSFTLDELQCGLNSLRSTSPGNDMLHNEMLKRLPLEYKLWMLRIINKSFQSSTILPEWKLAIILPILKPSKSPLEVTSYRPISLLSCFSKLIERFITNRITYIFEKNVSFSNTQGGFRKRLSCSEQIARFENVIRRSIYERKYVIAVFFDLSHAYDGIWHLGLQSKLAR